VKEPSDLCLDFGSDGHGCPPGTRLSWRKSLNSPTPASFFPRRVVGQFEFNARGRFVDTARDLWHC
jgi:hypothetical protein